MPSGHWGNVVGKHRKPAKKWGPYLTTGVALEAATLFGFANAIDSHVPVPNLLATSIFVDGTKSITGSEDGEPFFRMRDSFQGQFAQQVETDNVFIVYPRGFGINTGLGDPTYDESEADAAGKIYTAVRAAQEQNPNEQVYVVGYSQGSGAASKALEQLENPNDDFEYNPDNVTFVLASNPRRSDGGFQTRLPPGVYVPLVGVTLGGGITADQTKVVQVTKAYDGVSDSPDYLFNVVAGVNAILGDVYLHPGYYKDVDPNDPTAIVSTTPDGNIKDVLIPARPGELPLTMPLAQLGMPQNVLVALDPFLRSVIETGYDRPSGEGAYPTEPAPYRLVAPPDRWLSDLQSVATGAVQTTAALAGLVQPAAPLTGGNNNAEAMSALVASGDPPVLQTDPLAPKTTGTPADEAGGGVTTQRPVAADPVTGTGPNKTEAPRQPKKGWKPGDLLRSIFAPKVDAESQNGNTPANPQGTQMNPPTGDPTSAPTDDPPTDDPTGAPSTPAGSMPAA
jgi:hypothetical protein